MKLKDITTLSAGHPFRDKIFATPDTSIHVVQMKDVSPITGINWNNTIKTKLPGKSEPKWLKPDDILFAAKGNHYYAVLVDQMAAHIKAIAAPHFYIIRSTSNKILPAYLAWFLNQYSCQRYYQREAEGSVTRSIRRSVLEKTPIIAPPLTKQYSIIQLTEALKQQQQVIQQLNDNSNKLMRALSLELLNEPKKEIYQ